MAAGRGLGAESGLHLGLHGPSGRSGAGTRRGAHDLGRTVSETRVGRARRGDHAPPDQGGKDEQDEARMGGDGVTALRGEAGSANIARR